MQRILVLVTVCVLLPTQLVGLPTVAPLQQEPSPTAFSTQRGGVCVAGRRMYSFPTTRVAHSLSATTSQLRIAARRAQSVSHHSQLRVVAPVHTTQFLQESAGCSRRHKLPLPQLVLSAVFSQTVERRLRRLPSAPTARFPF